MTLSNEKAAGLIGRIFVHPKDAHCVLFHLITLLSYAAAFWVWLHPEVAGIHSVSGRAAFVGGAAVLLGWIAGIDTGVVYHNHVHRRVFRAEWLNVWFGRYWTIVGGWPGGYWQHAHIIVHHRHVLGEKDWTLPKRRADGRFEGIYRYSLLHPFRYARAFFLEFTRGEGRRLYGRRALVELLLFLPVWSVPFLIDPWMGAFLWLLPAFLANALVMGPGMYAQHVGCEAPTEGRPHAHSTTFLSPLFNATMFNIGYHIEHHSHPNVHWSELPRFHETFRDAILENRGHVATCGYYGAGRLLSRLWDPESGYREFMAQHPSYRVPGVSEPMPEELSLLIAGRTTRLQVRPEVRNAIG